MWQSYWINNTFEKKASPPEKRKKKPDILEAGNNDQNSALYYVQFPLKLIDKFWT